MCFRRLALAGVVALALAEHACMRSDTSPASFSAGLTAPSPAPTDLPSQERLTITGRVSETAPTSIVGVYPANITVVDGPDAGVTATTTPEGVFALKGLRAGTVTLTAAADGFESQTRAVTVQGGTSVSFQLNPKFELLRFTIPGDLASTDGTCTDGTAQRPCRIVFFPVHNAGPVEALLQWQPANVDLDINLFQMSSPTPMASQKSRTSSGWQIRADVAGSAGYGLHITYTRGTADVTYTLVLSYPK